MTHANPARDLTGLKVLVTGASRGLGQGMAIALAEAGATVYATARSSASLNETQQRVAACGGRCVPLELDLRAPSAELEAFVGRAWDAAGGLDVVFNNAGLVLYRPALETDDAAWDETLQVNLGSMFRLCRGFGRRMLDRGHGKLINVASDIGIRGDVNWAAYAASKGGVVSLSKSLAWEWAPKVSVNVIAPGPFYTDANKPMFDVPEIRAAVEARVPLARIGQPVEHLGPLAVLLAGTGSDFMTGAVFRIDGGICRS